MFFTDPISPSGEIQQVSTRVTLLTKVVWPALATLVPAAATAAFKWLETHGGRRRSSELTERISTLSKSIAELPPIQLSAAAALPSPQAAMTAELEAAIRELTALQAKAGRHLASSLSTTTAKLRSALLLYRPRGFGAWVLHACFFAWLALIGFFVIGVSIPDSSTGAAAVQAPAPIAPAQATQNGGQTSAPATTHGPGTFSSMSEFVVSCVMLGIPPLIIRYFAAKIHRRQCAQAQAAAGVLPVCPDPVTAPPERSGIAALG